jgi:Holliday junction resolvase
MSHYSVGTRFENKVRNHLKLNGYTVIRAAGSKGDSKTDLVAVKPGQVLFIQCKSNGLLGPEEWNRIHEVATWAGALPILAANGPHGRGVTYTHLLGRKEPRRHTQPTRPFVIDEIEETACLVSSDYDLPP